MKKITSIIVSFALLLSLGQPLMAKTKVNSSTNSTAKQVELTSVNLNKASAKEIAKSLKGIGLKKAQAIVAYRDKHGEFKAVEELASVKGIGVATIAKNHSKIKL